MAEVFGINGKTGELVRWLLGIVTAALISYYTALGAIENRVTAVETKQEAQFGELQRSFSDIRTDIRELRAETREAIRAGGKR